MTEQELKRVNLIEVGIWGKWTTNDNKYSFVFEPETAPGQVGKLLVIDHLSSNLANLTFQIFIKDSDPYIKLNNPDLLQFREYKIATINLKEKVLNLISPLGNEINFHLD